MSNLEEALSLAVKAHRGQKDKAGAPYVLHPIKIMLRMNNETEMIAAVLHDVVEDTEYTLQDLREAGYSETVLQAVDCLTHRKGENYEAYINRVQTNSIACKVKIADIEDNMDIRRLTTISPKDVERLKKYRQYWETLTGPKFPNQ